MFNLISWKRCYLNGFNMNCTSICDLIEPWMYLFSPFKSTLHSKKNLLKYERSLWFLSINAISTCSTSTVHRYAIWSNLGCKYFLQLCHLFIQRRIYSNMNISVQKMIWMNVCFDFLESMLFQRRKYVLYIDMRCDRTFGVILFSI